MRVLIQWAQSTPGGWIAVDSREWRTLPSRPDPTGANLRADRRPGWINRLCVQGVECTADHYAVEHIEPDGARVHLVHDDPRYYPAGQRFARVLTFLPLAPDWSLPRRPGRLNTRQSVALYLEPAMRARFEAAGPVEGLTLHSWTEWPAPNPALLRHGLEMPDALYLAHEDRVVRPRQDWRDWTEGLTPEQLDASGRASLTWRDG